MNKIEKRIDYIVNRITANLDFGDKDIITKEYVFKTIGCNNENAIGKLKDANTKLLNGLNNMLINAELLTRDRKHYSNDRRKLYLEFHNNCLTTIKNRRIATSVTDDIDELISLIDNNVQTIYRCRVELADILCTVNIPIRKNVVKNNGVFGKGLFSILSAISNVSEKEKKDNENYFKNEVLENTYLSPLEEEMVRNNEIHFSEFDDDKYYIDDDYDE